MSGLSATPGVVRAVGVARKPHQVVAPVAAAATEQEPSQTSKIPESGSTDRPPVVPKPQGTGGAKPAAAEVAAIKRHARARGGTSLGNLPPVPRSKLRRVGKVVQDPVVSLRQLRDLAWSGLPAAHRGAAWQLLLGYRPTHRSRQQRTLERKRSEYHDMVERYFGGYSWSEERLARDAALEAAERACEPPPGAEDFAAAAADATAAAPATVTEFTNSARSQSAPVLGGGPGVAGGGGSSARAGDTAADCGGQRPWAVTPAALQDHAGVPPVVPGVPAAPEAPSARLPRPRPSRPAMGSPSTSTDGALLRAVLVDCPRTAPGVPFVHTGFVQGSLERVLYIWATRHPASSYVQGINDIAIPFYAVFLFCNAGLPLEATDAMLEQVHSSVLEDVEADVYWCLTRILDSIQDHYTPGQPGLQKMTYRLKRLMETVDPELVAYLEGIGAEFVQLTFRWFNCLLVREQPFSIGLRLWDTLVAEAAAAAAEAEAREEEEEAAGAAASLGVATTPAGKAGRPLEDFVIFYSAAVLQRYAEQLRGMGFTEVMQFSSSPPTRTWVLRDLEEAIAKSYVLKTLHDERQAELG